MARKYNTESMIGEKYGILTVIAKGEFRSVVAECECGNTVECHFNDLRRKRRKSCGCLSASTTDGLYNHPLYSVWSSMKQRCLNPNCKEYVYYGERGIAINCDWLNDFRVFFKWAIENGWEENLELDRENNDGHYEPTNCRFITHKDNTNNQRNNRVFIIDGEKFTLAQLAEKKNVSFYTLWSRLDRGWSIEKTLAYGLNETRGEKIKCSNGTVYQSISQAARELGVGIQAIWRVCNGHTNHTQNGLVFNYI